MSHTKLPWALRPAWNDDTEFEIYPLERKFDFGEPAEIAVVRIYDESEANAEFIVKAVNAHDELVAALVEMERFYVELITSGDCGFWNPDDDQHVIMMRAALAKAGVL